MNDEVEGEEIDEGEEPDGNDVGMELEQVRKPHLVTNAKAAFDLNWELGIIADMNGLEFREGAAPLTLSAWMQVGMDLFGVYDSMQFCVGDWLNAGEALFGEDSAQAIDSKLDRAEAIAVLTHRDPQTLINWASTARKVPKERRIMKPREDDGRGRRLTYEHHYIVAALSGEEQVLWLDKALENAWSTRELKEAIADSKKIDGGGDAGDGGGGGGDGDGMTIAERIERAARLLWHQSQRTEDGGLLVSSEVAAQLGAALGEN